MKSTTHALLPIAPLLLLLAGCAAAPAPPAAWPAEAAPAVRPCPKGVPDDARCLGGTDSAGAHYLIAVPRAWNGHLVLHAHGGPLLETPTMARAEEDLTRWAVTVRAGYAWAGSAFAQPGVAVRAAATDTERLRRIVVAHVAAPKRTVLHGQSWGAGVAAVGAEMFTAGRPYDAVLLTAGVLGGGPRSYEFRADLRAVYQALCNNHPRPDEPAYPVWMGLPAGATMTRAELAERARQCLGVGLPAAQRTPEQARRLQTVLDVIRIPESSVLGHLNWATFHFQDISARRTGGRSVFTNLGVRYRGSPDDDALNAAVPRFAADAAAVRAFEHDTLPRGRIPVPVLTAHAIRDAIAFVELHDLFAQTMRAGGSGERLVQTFADFADHSYMSDAVYPALLDALLEWVETGRKPTPHEVAARCEAQRARWGGAECRFVPDYRVSPIDSRVAPRARP